MVKIIETPTLQTKRLLLKPLELEHTATLQKYFNNWNIIKNLNDKIPWPFPEDGCYDFYKNDALPRVRKGEAMLWTIMHNNEPIGLIEYRLIKKEGDQEDRGFWLAEPYWKKGLMTEAIVAINDYVFFELKTDKVTIRNYADNTGSHRIKEKTGTSLLSSFMEPWRDETRKVEIWELTAENWKKFREENF